MGRKQCWKRRNSSLCAISPFPTVFSKDSYCKHVKNLGLFGKTLVYANDVDVYKVKMNQAITTVSNIQKANDRKLAVLSEKGGLIHFRKVSTHVSLRNSTWTETFRYSTSCLILSQTTNFRIFQTERACIRHF